MSEVKNIIFDIGNVLLYDFPMESRFLYNIFLASKNKTDIGSFEAFLDLKGSYELPYHEWVYVWGKSLFQDEWDSIDKNAWDEVLLHWEASCIVIPDVFEALHDYQGDYLFSICANQPTNTLDYLEKKKLLSLFHAVVIDDGLGYSKPEPQIFLEVLQKMNLSAKQCLMVGDKYQVDVVPARTLGMQTALVLNDYNQMEKKARNSWEHDYIQHIKKFNEEAIGSDVTVSSVSELFKEIAR